MMQVNGGVGVVGAQEPQHRHRLDPDELTGEFISNHWL
jgi:hypothetical protein